jgi:hypothetical protein
MRRAFLILLLILPGLCLADGYGSGGYTAPPFSPTCTPPLTCTAAGAFTLDTTYLSFGVNTMQVGADAAAPANWTINAPDATAASAGNGGNITIKGGTKDGAGTQGTASLQNGAGNGLTINADGTASFVGNGAAADPSVKIGQDADGFYRVLGNGLGLSLGDSLYYYFYAGVLGLGYSTNIGFSANAPTAQDTFLSRGAAGTLNVGATSGNADGTVAASTGTFGASCITYGGVQHCSKEVTLTSADICGGDCGAATAINKELIAAQAGKMLAFTGATAIYDRATATYTGGGDSCYIAYSSGTQISESVLDLTLFRQASDRLIRLYPFGITDGSGALGLGNQSFIKAEADGVAINLLCNAAITNPGTAAGVLRVTVNYDVIATGL